MSPVTGLSCAVKAEERRRIEDMCAVLMVREVIFIRDLLVPEERGRDGNNPGGTDGSPGDWVGVVTVALTCQEKGKEMDIPYHTRRSRRRRGHPISRWPPGVGSWSENESRT